MNESRTADVAIVGGGVIGCSIAWHLTELGVSNVALFEKRSLASGATGICPGGIRQQFEGADDCRWALASMPFWESVNEILEPPQPFVFERSGYLFVAHEEATLARYAANVRRQNEVGVASQLVTPEEIAALLPALETGGLRGGAFCATDGFLEDCHGVTHLLAERARERGARVLFEEVVSIESPGTSGVAESPGATGTAESPGPAGAAGGVEAGQGAEGWRLITRTGDGPGRFDCGRVVVAAGVDSLQLAAGVGLKLPIVAERRRLAFTAPLDETVLPPLLIAADVGFAGKQLGHGGFYLGWLAEGGEEPEMSFLEHALTAGARLLPALADLPVRRVLAGTYDTTPDHRPLLGGVAGHDGLGLAVGFSGHGFMMAPAVGRALACWAADEEQPLPLAPFAVDRFGTADRAGGEGLVI